MDKRYNNVETMDLIVRGAIDAGIESTKDLIQTVARHSKGRIWFLNDDEPSSYNYFKGFFSGVLVTTALNRIERTITREGPTEVDKIDKIGGILWYELERFLEKRVDRYYEELRLIARREKNKNQ